MFLLINLSQKRNILTVHVKSCKIIEPEGRKLCLLIVQSGNVMTQQEIELLVKNLFKKKLYKDAIACLMDIGAPAIVPTAEALDRARSKEKYEDIMYALHRILTRVPEEGLKVLKSYPKHKYSILWCLQSCHCDGLVDEFVTAMSDRSSLIREVAVHGLLEQKDPKTIPVLVKALLDRSIMVKSVAVEAMLEFGDERALENLNHLANLKSIQQHNPGIVYLAKEAINTITERKKYNDSSPISQKRANMLKLTVTRDGVCAAADCFAPYEKSFRVQWNDSLKSVLKILENEYLPVFANGKENWIVRIEHSLHSRKPLAVIARQWKEPEFIIDPETPMQELFKSGSAKIHFHHLSFDEKPEVVVVKLRIKTPVLRHSFFNIEVVRAFMLIGYALLIVCLIYFVLIIFTLVRL
jgi:hypothetical protein